MAPEYRGGRDAEPPLRRAAGSQPQDGKPADELRVQPFTDDVFSEYHARRKDSRSPFGLIAGVVIGVAVVGGIGWYMWNSGALTSAAPTNGEPQLVKADPEPYKVKPENPGGMQVENQDKLVYDRVAKGEAPPRVENLLPAPEEPKAPPKPVAPPPEEVVPETPAAETAKTETAKIEPSASETSAPEVAKPASADSGKDVAKTEPAKPAEPSKPEQDDLAAAVLAATGGRESATGPIATAPESPEPAAAPEAPAERQVAVAPPVTPPVAGAFQVQLASARSEQGAMGEWNRIFGKNKDALAGLSPNVARVDLGEKGVFFRLRAGPLADKAAADALCANLAAQNVGCIVVRP